MSIFDKYFDDSSKGVISLDSTYFAILYGIIDRITISDTLKFENISIPISFAEDYKKFKDQKMVSEDLLISMIKRGYKIIDTIIAIKYFSRISEFKTECDRIPQTLQDVALSLATVIYYCLITGKTTLGKDDHVPAFLKRAPFNLTYDKFQEHADALTTSKLSLVVPYVLKSINLKKCDVIIKNRFKLGVAGTRSLRAFIESVAENSLSSDNLTFLVFCKKLLSISPCYAIHPLTH